MIIRPFILSDIAHISAILKNIGWADQYVGGQKRAIERLSNDPEGEVLVALIADKIVGYITVQHYRWNRLSYLNGLVVSSDSRRLGVASELVKTVEKSSRERGNRGIYVDTPVDNRAGRAFYEAIGYTQAYSMPQFYDVGLDGVTYIKFFERGS